MARTLDVYLHRNLVGCLIQDDHGELMFEYRETWLNDPNAVPVSQSLPLRKERYARRACRGFFGGILPEGDKREVLAKNLGISAKNDFAMLEEIGGECAGAITFLCAQEPLPEHEERYRTLSDTELESLLEMLPRRPLLAGEDDVRLSLAGAQDKIAVYIADGRISIPLGGAPSTHILKPAIERFAGVVFNESFCMKLAQAVGVPTAKTQIGSIRGIDYLLVERYDRIRIGAHSLQRLHQEDFCQALGIVSENKYQKEGGPSLEQCFRLVRETSSVPAIDLLSLLDAVIFNFLIGNNDAHGKNFSLLYRRVADGGVRLAPCYDLLSTVQYPELSEKMAMKIGGEYVSSKVSPKNFDQLAREAGLGVPLVKRRVPELATAILANLPAVSSKHLMPNECSTANEVAALIRSRCERTMQKFNE